MGTITFNPSAQSVEVSCAMVQFGLTGPIDGRAARLVDGSVATLTDRRVPCDVTLDPTNQPSWARAVYEAGLRIGRFADLAAKHQDQSILRDFPVDRGVAQQPAQPTQPDSRPYHSQSPLLPLQWLTVAACRQGIDVQIYQGIVQRRTQQTGRRSFYRRGNVDVSTPTPCRRQVSAEQLFVLRSVVCVCRTRL